MEGPTNLGEDYRTAFRQVYFNLLREYQGRIAYVLETGRIVLAGTGEQLLQDPQVQSAAAASRMRCSANCSPFSFLASFTPSV